MDVIFNKDSAEYYFFFENIFVVPKYLISLFVIRTSTLYTKTKNAQLQTLALFWTIR